MGSRMVFRFFLLIMVGFVFTAFPATGRENDDRNTLILRASTLGIGLEAGQGLGNYRLRLGAHFFTINSEQRIGQIDYDIEAKLAYGSVILDWYPRPSGFHLSAGLLYNADDIRALSKDAATYSNGVAFFPTEDSGRLVADVEYPSLAPFMGLGWEGSFFEAGCLGWLIEAGVAYLGQNTVYLETEGTLDGQSDELSQEALVIEDYFDKYSILPVVTLGLKYIF